MPGFIPFKFISLFRISTRERKRLQQALNPLRSFPFWVSTRVGERVRQASLPTRASLHSSSSDMYKNNLGNSSQPAVISELFCLYVILPSNCFLCHKKIITIEKIASIKRGRKTHPLVHFPTSETHEERQWPRLRTRAQTDSSIHVANPSTLHWLKTDEYKCFDFHCFTLKQFSFHF